VSKAGTRFWISSFDHDLPPSWSRLPFRLRVFADTHGSRDQGTGRGALMRLRANFVAELFEPETSKHSKILYAETKKTPLRRGWKTGAGGR
jgi:hypothetical protein